MLKSIRFLAFVLAALVLGCELELQEQAKKADKKEERKKEDKSKSGKMMAAPEKTAAAKPATYKVEKEPFKIDVSVKGIFESGDMTEVSLSPLVWSPTAGGGVLMVEKAVEHGTPVKKGDPILWLDTEKLDQTIKDLEIDSNLNELAIKLAEEELPILTRTTPMDIEAAERAKKHADEDLKRYKDVDRGFMLTDAEQMLKQARQQLDYEKEELKQLEKMYKANDLTEDTEEIILKRQRNYVEMYEYYVKEAEWMRNRIVNISVPRRDRDMEESTVKRGLDLEKARNTLPLSLNQKRLSLSKMKYDREKNAERLAKLKKDREGMIVKAPTDGTVYYGKCSRGQWNTASSVAGKLQRGGMLMPEEVLMTIVKPRPLFVRAVVEEKDLHSLQPGMAGKTTPTMNPDLKLSSKLQNLSTVPVTPGSFEARIELEGDKSASLVPGMACTVKFVPYLKKETLTVPSSAVFAEELDEDKHYVYLLGKDSKGTKHAVTIGKKSGSKTEILKGLSENDEILQQKPTPEAKKDETKKEGTE